MEYSRDPRYFGTSFKGLLKKAIKTEKISEGTQLLTLSKKENVEILSEMKISSGESVDHLMYVTGNFETLANVTLNKEIYVVGEASIGEGSTLRALAAEGKVWLAPNTNVIRWVDAEGAFSADSSCDLGWSISSGKRLEMSSGCRFRRLFGMPVQTWSDDSEKEIPVSGHKGDEIEESAFIGDRNWTIIPPHTKIDKTLIFKQNLRIKRHCILDQDVKTYKNLVLEEGVRIKGNVFVENSITTGPSTRIFGNVFSQESIRFGIGTKIGREGSMKSVVARGDIVLDRAVAIYGYVVAGKRGRVL
jgi:predicted acyltransferase (DUF342 family)